MNQCANCGEGEAILFTCSHCDLQFCADHQFPHHACERFSSGGSAAGDAEEAAFVYGDSAAVAKPKAAGSADPMEGPPDDAPAGATDAAPTGPDAGSTADAETVPETGTPETAPETTPPESADPDVSGSESPEQPTVADDEPELSNPKTVPGPRTEPVARDAARDTRPDREGPSPEPPGRGMPWERAEESPVDWMRKQSLPGFLLKVGTLSLVFSLAYYAGLAAVLYGYF